MATTIATSIALLALAASCICNAVVIYRHTERLSDIEQRLQQGEKYKSRPVAGKLERIISAPFVPGENCQVFYELSPKPMKPSEDSPAASDEAENQSSYQKESR